MLNLCKFNIFFSCEPLSRAPAWVVFVVHVVFVVFSHYNILSFYKTLFYRRNSNISKLVHIVEEFQGVVATLCFHLDVSLKVFAL